MVEKVVVGEYTVKQLSNGVTVFIWNGGKNK